MQTAPTEVLERDSLKGQSVYSLKEKEVCRGNR